ncbi:tail fiber domain-containing protein [Phaeobacter sp. HF9A]|uniref:tail fiber domain-containing protein n=1 Tax=Phaeobacter sp. HF9A TaxID=2721561 RepID=UPI00143022AE|nr:tail fiber domain-containing protein [Phaeobacter sp. HF9A]NIZ12914.1 tail fiber domain-containing protein [Phaeobacter sp. HF9A]
MAWVSTGTVNVTNGSTTVTGTGTSWFGALQNGWGFVGPDGRVYEILTVDDATALTLKTTYQGATAAGQIYAAFPTGSLSADLAASVQALVANHQGVFDTVGQGRFTGDVVFDADRDTGMGNPSSNEVALKAGGDWQLRLKAGQASGAAVQASPDDTTAGRLMKVGAFGLGGNALIPPNNDLNDIGATTGLWRGGEAGIANSPPAGPVIVQHLVRSTDAYVQIAVTRGHEAQQMFVRHKTQTYGWSDWEKAVMLDGSGILPDNIEIRNSGPYLSLTDQDTGVKHTISANSTAGHLYIKTDPAENMPNSALLIETGGARQMAISKDEIDINVPIGTYLGIGVAAQSPATALHIKGTGVTDSKMTVERSGVTGAVGVVSQDLLLNGTGSTGTNGGINFYSGGGSSMRLAPDGTLRPANDGTQNLGNASYRWDVVYASTGAINTSDARTKTDIQDLDEAERRAAIKAKGLLKKYRLRDAVAKKGDAARWHFGIIAQELAAAFEDEGLDPWRYGVLCWDEWWSAEFEIPAETAPIMREVVERVVHTYPVLDEAGEPTGETREKVEEVRKKVDTGEVKIVEPARTELRKYDREEDAPEGAEYHNRQGVRYDELFAFILAAL